MSPKYFQLDASFTRKLWKKLRDNQVPIVTAEDYKHIDKTVESTNTDLRTMAYMPSIGHGYLSLQKGRGVTRFLPVLTAIDMAVYYHICFEISGSVIKKVKGVFGGWHWVPNAQEGTPQDTDEALASVFSQDYFSDPFSSSLWLKEWRQFTDLIGELCEQKGIGNYVVQTDIANFYDTIEIPRLIKSLRRDAPGKEEYIEALEVFLSFWSRRLIGYQASTKGIPQEIISDASRVLSHYYLGRFDEEFSKYCAENGLVFVRWADDILVFGSSKKRLELSIHHASKILLSDGLNLSAAKTRIFTRADFARYRGIKVLSAISTGDAVGFRRSLRAALIWRKGNDIRIDSIFRATIGFVSKMGAAAHSFEKSFLIEEARSDLDLLMSLNARQLLNLITIADDPAAFFRFALDRIISVPFAAPRATFLHMLRKHRSALAKSGVSKIQMQKSVEKIAAVSSDSEIVTHWCIPPTLKALGL